MDTPLLVSVSASFYTVAFGLLAIYAAAGSFYRLFLSPLRSVPGPWYAAISDFWLMTHVLRFRRCRAINDLLLKYGPIVRVAPNTVIFLDASTMKLVYGVSSKLPKSIFYKSLIINETDHAMTTLEHAPHLARKRGYVAHYNAANVALFQPEIHDYVNDMVNLLTNNLCDSLTPVDTLLLFHHLFIDINCLHLFAHKPRSLQAWANHILHGGVPDQLGRAIGDFPKCGLLRGTLPKKLWNALRRIPVHRWQLFCDSSAILESFGFECLRDRRASYQTDVEKQRRPLITRLLGHTYSDQVPMPDADIVSECIGHLIAGTDTTSSTLSFLLWELSRRRDIMLRLQAELDECMPDASHIPDIQDLQRLPYLSALIKEGLRVYSAAPSPLERVTPESGDNGMTLLGHTMPTGTIIASQAFSSHRHPGVFFSPDLFLPERWLLEDSPSSTLSGPDAPSETMIPKPLSVTPVLPSSPELSTIEKGATTTSALRSSPNQAQMATHMFPFGYGPRTCGGQNLAQMMLRIVIAALARNFDIVAPPETNERSMAMKDSFVAFPAALECKLIFVRRSCRPSTQANDNQ